MARIWLEYDGYNGYNGQSYMAIINDGIDGYVPTSGQGDVYWYNYKITL